MRKSESIYATYEKVHVASTVFLVFVFLIKYNDKAGLGLETRGGKPNLNGSKMTENGYARVQRRIRCGYNSTPFNLLQFTN